MDADPAAAVTPAQPSRRPIGEFLVERGLVTPDELAAALAQQRLSGQRLGEILVERGSISRMSLASVLGEQWEEAGRHLRAVVPVRLADGKEAEGGLAGGQELHESLASLQQAVARLEDLAGDVDGERPVTTESSVAADVLVRLERLEAELRDGSLGERFTAGIEALRTDLAQVRAALAQPVTADEALMLRLGRIEESLQDRATDGVEQRLVALDEWLRGRDDDALGESVTEALDQLRARLDRIESSVAAPVERLERLEQVLAERDERSQEPGVETALVELRSGLDELRSVVERAPAADEALAGRFDRLEAALASQHDDEPGADPELLGRLDRIDAALAHEDSAEPAWVDELRGAVSGPPARDEELHERLARLEASLAAPQNDEVAAELDRLRAAIEQRPEPDHGVHEQLDRIEAHLVESAPPEPFEVPPRRDDELHERLGRIEAALAGLDPSGSFTAAVHELRETIAHAAQPDGSILERLDQLGAALADRSGEDLASRLDRIEARLAEAAALPEPFEVPPRRDDELHERLARIEAVLTHAEDDDGETTAALSALADRMVELRAAVERPDESMVALHERLDALEAALGESRTDGVAERLHGIAAALDEVRDLQRRPPEPDAELYASLERIESLAAAHVSREPLEDVRPSGPDAGEIAGRVREAVGERLDGVEHSLREAIAAAASKSPDAGEIAGRIHESTDYISPGLRVGAFQAGR
jgi:chromosome segregation ATPase